jgi:hypothetical protein
MLDDTFNRISAKYSKDKLADMPDKDLINGQKEIIAAIAYYRVLEVTVKRLANSVYGAFGTNANRYFLQACAEDICAEGQFYIKLMDKTQNDFFKGPWMQDAEFVKELKAQEFGHIIPEHITLPNFNIYKDVTNYIDTDSLLHNSIIELDSGSMTIEQFYNANIKNGSAGETAAGHESVKTESKVLNYADNKLYYAPVERIIRHKVSKAKWRLRTTTGKEVIVTNDHSMIVFRDGVQTEVKPSEILKTDKILCIRQNK